jgi:hypothetical protein
MEDEGHFGLDKIPYFPTPLHPGALLPLVIVGKLVVGTNPRLRFQPKLKFALGVSKIPMGILEIGGNSLLKLKPKLCPPPKMKPDIRTHRIIGGILSIGKMVEGRYVTDGIPSKGTSDA